MHGGLHSTRVLLLSNELSQQIIKFSNTNFQENWLSNQSHAVSFKQVDKSI